MTVIKLGPEPSALSLASAPRSARPQTKGGMFYRWHMRRERIRELKDLLSLEPQLLADIGVTPNQVRAEIMALRRTPV
jgi:uncharacterized protein YjiS (DUF1127 family)